MFSRGPANHFLDGSPTAPFFFLLSHTLPLSLFRLSFPLATRWQLRNKLKGTETFSGKSSVIELDRIFVYLSSSSSYGGVYPARRSASPKESEPDPVPERRSRAPSLDPSLNDRPFDPNPLCLSPAFHEKKEKNS